MSHMPAIAAVGHVGRLVMLIDDHPSGIHAGLPGGGAAIRRDPGIDVKEFAAVVAGVQLDRIRGGDIHPRNPRTAAQDHRIVGVSFIHAEGFAKGRRFIAITDGHRQAPLVKPGFQEQSAVHRTSRRADVRIRCDVETERQGLGRDRRMTMSA